MNYSDPCTCRYSRTNAAGCLDARLYPTLDSGRTGRAILPCTCDCHSANVMTFAPRADRPCWHPEDCDNACCWELVPA